MYRQNTADAVLNSGNECPKCNGTGYITSRDESGYTVCEPCPVCRKKKRSSDATGIPAKYHDADLGSFRFDIYSGNVDGLKRVITRYFEKYPMCEKRNKGLYLWSKTTGSGKTFLSCCLARSIMVKYDLQMKFTTAPDYLKVVGESYNRQQGAEDGSEVYRTCSLLVLDDIGTQRNGEWQEQELFRLINERQNEGKITFFTSNNPPDQLKVSGRVIDRIIKGSIVLQLPEESIRRRNAQKEQEQFLNELLKD